MEQRQIGVREPLAGQPAGAAARQDVVEIAEIFRQPRLAQVSGALRRLRLLVLVVTTAGDGMMAVVNLGNEIGDGELQPVHPEAAGIVLRRQSMTLAEE